MHPVRGSDEESFRLFTRKCQLIGQSLAKTQGISNGKLVQANKWTFNMAVEVKSNIAWGYFQPSPKNGLKVKMRNVCSRRRVVYDVS